MWNDRGMGMCGGCCVGGLWGGAGYRVVGCGVIGEEGVGASGTRLLRWFGVGGFGY